LSNISSLRSVGPERSKRRSSLGSFPGKLSFSCVSPPPLVSLMGSSSTIPIRVRSRRLCNIALAALSGSAQPFPSSTYSSPSASLHSYPSDPIGAHKTRDKRCSLAAPLLESVLTSTLSSHGISVDNTGSSLHHLPSSSSIDAYPEESREESVERVLREMSSEGSSLSSSSASSNEVGLFKISHLGGHRVSCHPFLFFSLASVAVLLFLVGVGCSPFKAHSHASSTFLRLCSTLES
jgi:hypothetical protein